MHHQRLWMKLNEHVTGVYMHLVMHPHQMSSPRCLECFNNVNFSLVRKLFSSLSLELSFPYCLNCGTSSYVTSCKLFRNIYLISSTLERCLFVKLIFSYFCVLFFFKWECNLWKSIAQFVNFFAVTEEKLLESRLGVLC